MMTKKKILFVISGLERGGVEVLLYKTIRRLENERSNNDSVIDGGNDFVVAGVVNLSGRGKEISDKIRELGVPVWNHTLTTDSSLVNLVRGLWVVWQIKRLARRIGVNIIHGLMFHGNIIARLCRVKGVKVVNAQRNVDVWRKWYHNLVDRWTCGLVDLIVCCSHVVRDDTIKRTGFLKGKFVMVHNGTDVDSFKEVQHNEQTDNIVVGSLCSLTEQKGLKYGIRALKHLVNKGYKVKYLIAGKGPLLESLQSEIKGSNLDVHFLGEIQDIPLFMLNLDVFWLPSLWEGLANVLLEAGAAGLPSVACGVGGVREVIKDGRTGFLVQSKSALELADKTEILINNPKLRLSLGQQARRFVKTHFSLQKHVKRLIKVWEEVTQ